MSPGRNLLDASEAGPYRVADTAVGRVAPGDLGWKGFRGLGV